MKLVCGSLAEECFVLCVIRANFCRYYKSSRVDTSYHSVHEQLLLLTVPGRVLFEAPKDPDPNLALPVSHAAKAATA